MKRSEQIVLSVGSEWADALARADYPPEVQVGTLTARVDLLVDGDPVFAPREGICIRSFFVRLSEALSRALLGYCGQTEVHDADGGTLLRLMRREGRLVLTSFAPRRRELELPLVAVAESVQEQLHLSLQRTRELPGHEAVELWRRELAACERRLLRALRHVSEHERGSVQPPSSRRSASAPDGFTLDFAETVPERRAPRVDAVRMLRHRAAWTLRMGGVSTADVVALSPQNIVVRQQTGIDLIELDNGEVVPFTTGSHWRRFGDVFLATEEFSGCLTLVAADGELLVAKNYTRISMRPDDVRAVVGHRGRFYVAGVHGLFLADSQRVEPLVRDDITHLAVLSHGDLVYATSSGELVVFDLITESVRCRQMVGSPLRVVATSGRQVIAVSADLDEPRIFRFGAHLSRRWDAPLRGVDAREELDVSVAGEEGAPLVVTVRAGQNWIAYAFDPLTDQLQLYKRNVEEAPLRAVMALPDAVVVGTDRELVAYPIRGQSPEASWMSARALPPHSGPAIFRSAQGLVAWVDDDLRIFDSATGRCVSRLEGGWLHAVDVVFDEHFSLSIVSADEEGGASLHRVALQGMLASVPMQRSA